jgi:glycosyltransferase involved in cell wall biosynthesis
VDIFVLPSLTEGLSNAIMEAMACGRCVIASDVGGNPELITNRETGLLFPVQDQKALIRALQMAVDDVGLREALAGAGAARMQAGFSTARAAERMQEIYGAVLSCAS